MWLQTKAQGEEMKLEIGKRYVRRDGVVTDRIRGANCKTRWATDGQYTWLADGGHYLENKAESTMDIVSEYIEPKPDEPQQPLRWVENCKPDKLGIWLWRQNDGYVHCHYVDNNRINETWKEATRCYLGPIPEILPPVKKVTERAWMEPRGGGLWEEHWCVDDNRKAYHPDWIRTDRTREREC